MISQRLQKERSIRGDGLKVSNVYLDIGYYSLSTSSVTFKNKFGIGQKGMVNLFFSFQSVDF
jgi:AraC-like DNA-binding protein